MNTILAHEVYVLKPTEIETAMHTVSPNPFTAIPSHELEFIGWGVVIALVILSVLAISISPFCERKLRRFLVPLKKFAPLVARITLGLALVASGYYHALFGPELPMPEIMSISVLILGFSILLGWYVRMATALALCIFVMAIVSYDMYMLTYANYLGEMILTLILGAPGKGKPFKIFAYLEKYSFLMLRVLYGSAIIFTAVYAKFLHSSLAMETISNYHLTNYFPFSPLFLVLGAFLIEIMIGICIVVGFEIRFASLVFTLFLILSISFFGEAVWPHLILFGVNIVLFCHGYDKYTLTQLLFQRKRGGEPVL